MMKGGTREKGEGGGESVENIFVVRGGNEN